MIIIMIMIMIMIMIIIIAALQARDGAPKLRKSTNSRKFGNHVTVHRTNKRPSVHTTGKPMFTLTLSS